MFIPAEERSTTAVTEPPKRRRRIWTEGESGMAKWSIRIETDGVAHSDLMRIQEEGDVVSTLGGGIDRDGWYYGRPCTVESAFDAYVQAHLRHGWTVESLTSTEAKMWRAA